MAQAERFRGKTVRDVTVGVNIVFINFIDGESISVASPNGCINAMTMTRENTVEDLDPNCNENLEQYEELIV